MDLMPAPGVVPPYDPPSDPLVADAFAQIDPVLSAFALAMVVTVDGLPKEKRGTPMATAGAAAVNLAKRGAATDDLSDKLSYAIAAAYAASYFGLPPNTLLVTVEQICDTFAMTSNQRTALHQQAMVAYKLAIRDQEDLQRRTLALLEKGNPMSGVFRDGVLGSEAYRDGSLGILMNQPRQYADGSLGAALMAQPGAYHDGALGSPWSAVKSIFTPVNSRLTTKDPRARRQRRATSGLGCGCAGLGAEVVATEVPSSGKTLLYVGGAALVLGGLFYALKKR